MRKTSLKFRVHFRLPPMLTVLRAAKRYEPDFDAGNVRIYNGKGLAYGCVGTAVACACCAAVLRNARIMQRRLCVEVFAGNML
jgi:hypothetical protein